MTTDLVVAPAGAICLDEHEAYIRRVCGEFERQWLLEHRNSHTRSNWSAMVPEVWRYPRRTAMRV
ncbi:hypothetical protein [Streptomyces umbrinus]|uniref:hypothetical protein n=1 Tax=Streptomyces umbrinus TaxID=67370 RepID=UPI00167BD637|nr:hypothetical protein [Streptomyces umbrinus]